MTSPDHAELRRLAEAAQSHTPPAFFANGAGPREAAWSEFYANANPAAILALLDELERLREAVEMVHADYCKNNHYISAETGYVLGGLVCEDETQPIPDPLGALRSRVSELEGALDQVTEAYKVTTEILFLRMTDGDKDQTAKMLKTFEQVDKAYVAARAALSRAGEAADRGGEDG